MSGKKQKQRRRRRRRLAVSPSFALGTAVRVRPGIMDPDYPDIPLGGWAGTITDIDPRRPITYLVKWNQATRDAMHPVFRKRCRRDDFEIHEQWVGEEDLEEDIGTPGIVEQPTCIVTSLLNPSKRDDRVRAVFGLTSDDPLPGLNVENLRIFHRHLRAHLVFPIPARWFNFDLHSLVALNVRIRLTGLLEVGAGDLDRSRSPPITRTAN